MKPQHQFSHSRESGNPVRDCRLYRFHPGPFRFHLVFDLSFALSLSKGRPLIVRPELVEGSLSKGRPLIVHPELVEGSPSKGRPFIVRPELVEGPPRTDYSSDA